MLLQRVSESGQRDLQIRWRYFSLAQVNSKEEGWTLWGAIQHATSPLDFDFWAWAMERYEAAAAGLSSSEFTTLLDEVQRED